MTKAKARGGKKKQAAKKKAASRKPAAKRKAVRRETVAPLARPVIIPGAWPFPMSSKP
jgi:hypothetical protein